ncbi:MAG TPA: DUF1786 family protein [Anaerolineales bacterium]|jgi:uncharacterized protein (DUF1786 family)
MKFLTVDVGTGTQDIFLYDSELDVENGFKLVLPSPTMLVHRQIKTATARREAILLTGVTMGGGPSAWAAEAHARAGLPLYATPSAARTFNDELEKVERMGIHIVSEDESLRLPTPITRLELKDFDFSLIEETFASFGVLLHDLAAVGVAVFDHGNAPPGISDRQFRFDYLDDRIRATNSLFAFAHLPAEIPASMTRLQAVASSASELPCPLVVMDTAPAAILGAAFDPLCAASERRLVVNVGNFHTIAFRLGAAGIEGVFEHHTGEIDRPRLENFLRALAEGSLKHSDIFNDMGHGALVYGSQPLELGRGDWDLVVTGPRRSMFSKDSAGSLRPYFAVPFGDMMLTGNFGLLAAAAERLPAKEAEVLRAGLYGLKAKHNAPWELES